MRILPMVDGVAGFIKFMETFTGILIKDLICNGLNLRTVILKPG